MAVKGVRSSWLIIAMKAACARSARCAAYRASTMALTSLAKPRIPSKTPSAVRKGAALACIQHSDPSRRCTRSGTWGDSHPPLKQFARCTALPGGINREVMANGINRKALHFLRGAPHRGGQVGQPQITIILEKPCLAELGDTGKPRIQPVA